MRKLTHQLYFASLFTMADELRNSTRKQLLAKFEMLR